MREKMPHVLREPQDPEGNRGAKAQKAQKLTADSRRFTQMETKRNPFKNITAEASLDWARDPELVEGQRAQRIIFCLSGDDDKQKPFPIRSVSFCPIVVSRLGKKGFPQRTLRLCGEMSESLSAIIGENLRLKLFAGLTSWRENRC